jgi:hypothetical protein
LPRILLALALCVSAGAQTIVINAGGSSGSSGGSGITAGLFSAIPATCAVGGSYVATDQPVSQQLYFCTATNTWSQFMPVGPTGALTITNGAIDIVPSVVPQLNLGNAFTGSNSFAGTTTVNNLTVSGTCTGCGAAGGGTWNGITAPTANEALAMAAYTSTWTWGAATGASTNMFTLTDTLNNTGTGYVLDVETAAGSAASPIRIKSSNTAGVQVLYTACSTTACSNFGTAAPNYYPVGGAGGPGSTMVKADNDIIFMASNTGRWYISSAGDFKAASDNTYNIGAAGANRPATVYVSKRVISGVNTVTSSATPTFDLSLGDFQTMTLTANVTAVTFSNIAAGHKFVLDLVQDATGSRTIAGMPAAMHGFTTIGATALKHNVQEFYSPDGTNLYAVAAGSINQ